MRIRDSHSYWPNERNASLCGVCVCVHIRNAQHHNYYYYFYLRGTWFVRLFSHFLSIGEVMDDENRSHAANTLATRHESISIAVQRLHPTAIRFALLNRKQLKIIIKTILWWFTQYSNRWCGAAGGWTQWCDADKIQINSISFSQFRNDEQFFCAHAVWHWSPPEIYRVDSTAAADDKFSFSHFDINQFFFLSLLQFQIYLYTLYRVCAIFFINNAVIILYSNGDQCAPIGATRRHTTLEWHMRHTISFRFHFFFIAFYFRFLCVSFLVVIYLFWLPINNFYFP